MKEKIDFLYHVAMDLETEEKEFVPRIPKYRCKDEDATIPRVCVCPTLEGAIGAFPYKSYYVNEYMRRRNENYLVYHKIPTTNLEYKTNEEIKELVPDSHITKEYWILNNFKSKPNIIKVKKIKLSNYNKHIDEYSGFVEEFEYEKSIEDYDREMEYIFVDKQFFKKAIRFAIENNISYEILEDNHYHLWYERYKVTNINFNGTTKKYRWIKVKFNIPKNFDVSQLWVINNYHNDFLQKKNITTRPFIMDEENRKEIIECLMCYFP